MDQSVQRLLTDKLYDKRKQGALELERIVREASANKDTDKIGKIVEQLCHDYAYAVHQPHARNGGLIGLAAASIALGSEEVAPYLQEIVPPVLACFTDQDARVRYYACESMYNIAKVAKGEILLFFNDIFDALCKLAADSELSVKNGAELLDRLVKDIVSESAASYVSVLQVSEKHSGDRESALDSETSSTELPTAFSLAKFIPLLKERIHVINPFTRTFLVSWLTLLDTIPDLELVYYLPEFLGGLFKFLSDPNRDVYVATQGILERFLSEIKKIAKIRKGLEDSRKSNGAGKPKPSSASDSGSVGTAGSTVIDKDDNAIADSDSGTANDAQGIVADGDWVPGQDVQVDHAKILDILLTFVDTSSHSTTSPSRTTDPAARQKEEEISIVALRWIDSFFEISPEDILQFVPRLLSQVLPALASDSDQLRTTANRVNTSLMEYIVTFSEDNVRDDVRTAPPSRMPTSSLKDSENKERQSSAPSIKPTPSTTESVGDQKKNDPTSNELTPRSSAAPTPQPSSDLDYAAAVNALTLQFLNEHEATRVAALAWLIMLHRKAPRKVLAFNDGTFPALLKTLSDPAEAVVIRDLQLLSQISRNSEDGYFSSFMVNLLQLFSTDRKLLEIRGNLIIRQLCMNLSPERIYRTMADCLEKDEDIEFASIMIQNLNNNLITAPELADLRKRLRNLDSKDGQIFFAALFRSWCHNAVATFSLCLLAQAYEQAYNLLQIFAELEMTVNMLIQIDKLVQLLESPVFTYLRLQLLEPERYPYLYKCLYGLLMLLPQSSAFAALKNRLNSVSAIALLHTGGSRYVPLHHTRQRSSEIVLAHQLGGLTSSSSALNVAGSGAGTPTAATYAEARAPGRLGSKAREGAGGGGGGGDGAVKWGELLEKFRTTQEKSRRMLQRPPGGGGGFGSNNGATGSVLDLVGGGPSIGDGLGGGGGAGPGGAHEKAPPDVPRGADGSRPASAQGHNAPRVSAPQPPAHRSRTSLGNFGRLTGGIGNRSKPKR